MSFANKPAIKAANPDTRSIKPEPERAPHYVWHASFEAKSSLEQYDPATAPSASNEKSLGYLPDEETRDIVRRMHYAAYRADTAKAARERRTWKQAYFDLRDRVVLGNRKLVFRAIRKNSLVQHMADDLIGECDIIMIRAVAAYNPWMGIRFSTYAFTCLMRGLARLSRRMAAKRFLNFIPLDAASEDALGEFDAESSLTADFKPVEEFFHAGHSLLSYREKVVLKRRFGFSKEQSRATLETLGADLGISKERVRQVQSSAIAKLRQALEPNG
jgi:RNA polymerase sigma factor (sigma-70 family)